MALNPGATTAMAAKLEALAVQVRAEHAYAASGPAVERVINVAEHAAGQAYETVTHPGQWFGQSAGDHSGTHFTGPRSVLSPERLAQLQANYAHNKAAFDHFRQEIHQDRELLNMALNPGATTAMAAKLEALAVQVRAEHAYAASGPAVERVINVAEHAAGQAYETVTHPGQWFGQSAPAASTPHPAVDRQQAQQHQAPHLVQSPTHVHAPLPPRHIPPWTGNRRSNTKRRIWCSPPRMYMHHFHSTALLPRKNRLAWTRRNRHASRNCSSRNSKRRQRASSNIASRSNTRSCTAKPWVRSNANTTSATAKTPVRINTNSVKLARRCCTPRQWRTHAPQLPLIAPQLPLMTAHPLEPGDRSVAVQSVLATTFADHRCHRPRWQGHPGRQALRTPHPTGGGELPALGWP